MRHAYKQHRVSLVRLDYAAKFNFENYAWDVLICLLIISEFFNCTELWRLPVASVTIRAV